MELSARLGAGDLERDQHMFSPLLNSVMLRGLYAEAMARAFLRYRNPRRRQIGRHHVAFHERIWREAALALGASFTPLGAGIADIELNGCRTRVVENTCEIDGPVTLALLLDKPLTYQVLESVGLPTPPHAVFSLGNTRPAQEFLARTSGCCVVKPANGTGGGRGITTGIRRPSHLARAAAIAAVYADELLIEQQIEGENFRLLFLDGELLDAFVRRPPSVIADGRSTVAGLVRQANQERLKQGAGVSQVLLAVDLDMRRTLARQGLSLGSVPAAGTRVILKTVVNENCGADNSTVTHWLCPSIVQDAARAVEALGVRLAGVDIIAPDATAPLAESKGVFLEVNAPPNYYYHYHKRDAVFPVAWHVLRRLLLEGATERSQFIRPVPVAPVGGLR